MGSTRPSLWHLVRGFSRRRTEASCSAAVNAYEGLTPKAPLQKALIRFDDHARAAVASFEHAQEIAPGQGDAAGGRGKITLPPGQEEPAARAGDHRGVVLDE